MEMPIEVTDTLQCGVISRCKVGLVDDVAGGLEPLMWQVVSLYGSVTVRYCSALNYLQF